MGEERGTERPRKRGEDASGEERREGALGSAGCQEQREREAAGGGDGRRGEANVTSGTRRRSAAVARRGEERGGAERNKGAKVLGERRANVRATQKGDRTQLHVRINARPSNARNSHHISLNASPSRQSNVVGRLWPRLSAISNLESSTTTHSSHSLTRTR